MENAEGKVDIINIQTAVRVRPFNSREIQLNAENIVAMSDMSLSVADPQRSDDRQFTFDFCHWSFDGFKITEARELVPDGPESRYAGQGTIFQDIGIPAMNKALEGYNVAIIAYGQTGSGKTHTMIGNESDPGIIHQCINYLFSELNGNPETKYKVTFSLLEIYSENIVDLLSKTSHALVIKERRDKGVYIPDLTVLQTRSAGQVEELLALGLRNRSIAATQMNSNSSRSHLFFTLNVHQFIVTEGSKRFKRKSRIRFVDTAGSERSTKSGATGDRLLEASKINLSNAGFGAVINALANAKNGKPSFVPYRNSKMTRLLSEELGGNCFTTLISNISPASDNHDETISTLRLTNRVKMVVQKPRVNAINVDNAIKTMKQKIEQIENEMASAESEEKKIDLRESLETFQEGIQKLDLPWKEKDTKELGGIWRSALTNFHEADYKTTPFLLNVSDDAVLCGVVKHLLPTGHNLVGRSQTDKVNIELSGLGIQPWHAVVVNTGSALTIVPCCRRASVHINGSPITTSTKLSHLDHIKLGASEMFIFMGLPSDRTSEDKPDAPKHSYEKFTTELAVNHHLYHQLKPVGSVREQTAAHVLLQEFANLLPLVDQANAIAAAFGKKMDFSVSICKNQKLFVKVADKDLAMEWVWSKRKFEDRHSEMDALYSSMLSSSQTPQLGHKNNPFYDEEKVDTLLGSVTVSLHNILYLLPMKDEVPVQNANGEQVASLCINMTPCSSDGTPLQAPAKGTSLPNPMELTGKELNMSLAIPTFHNVVWVAGYTQRGVYCKVLMEGQNDDLKTETVTGAVNGQFQNKFHITFKAVTEKLLDFLQMQGLQLELWGTQAPLSSPLPSAPVTSSSPAEQSSNTKESLASNGPFDNGMDEGVVLDLCLAQDLRQFFKSIGPVGQKLKNLKTQADENSRAQEVRFHSWADCSTQLQTAEELLHTCVGTLRESVKSAIQRSKKS